MTAQQFPAVAPVSFLSSKLFRWSSLAVAGLALTLAGAPAALADDDGYRDRGDRYERARGSDDGRSRTRYDDNSRFERSGGGDSSRRSSVSYRGGNDDRRSSYQSSYRSHYRNDYRDYDRHRSDRGRYQPRTSVSLNFNSYNSYGHSRGYPAYRSYGYDRDYYRRSYTSYRPAYRFRHDDYYGDPFGPSYRHSYHSYGRSYGPLSRVTYSTTTYDYRPYYGYRPAYGYKYGHYPRYGYGSSLSIGVRYDYRR